jgi:flagellar basal body-associated protein FliL
MRNTVETDATIVRLNLHPQQNKKWIALALIILAVIILCTLAFISSYYYNKNKHRPEEPRQQDGKLVH